MTKTYDFTAQSWYLKLSGEKITSTREISPQVVCDLDTAGYPVGIEFINLSEDKFHSMTERLELIAR